MLLGSQPGAAVSAHPWCQGRVQFPSAVGRSPSGQSRPLCARLGYLPGRPGARTVPPRCVPWHKHRPLPEAALGPGRDGTASPLLAGGPSPGYACFPAQGPPAAPPQERDRHRPVGALAGLSQLHRQRSSPAGSLEGG